MSLFALPVSQSDLMGLQQAIRYATDATEATAKAAAINAGSDTVDNYASTMWNDVRPLAQVAMLVDTLMNGVTDTTTELQHLVRDFLPQQVLYAITHGFDITTYAAEAVGLGLAGYGSFWANYGGMSDGQFVSSVSAITGVNSTAITSWLSNWTSFYTSNPPAGVTVAQAARGATFGDACGIVLTSPTANATIIALNVQNKNAQMCIATNQYSVGVPFSSLPTHSPFQGA